MDLDTSINTFLVSEGLQGIYECIKPIKFKIDDIDPMGRFVNLFGIICPLCGVAHTAAVLEAQFLHVRGIKSSQKTLLCTDYH